jgi:hypothetical protein
VRSALRWWCVLALAAPLAACHRVEFRTRLPRDGEVREKTLDYFLFGIVGQHELDLDAMCPSGVAGWRTESIAWVDVLTLGIYTPRRVVVQCAGVKR